MQTRRVPRKANNRLPPRKEDRPLLAAAWPAAVLGRALALASGSGGGGGRAGRPVPGLRALARPPVPPSCLLLPACLFLCFLIPTGARVVSFSYCVVANPWAALLRVAFSFVPFRWVFSLGFPGRRPRGGGSRARMASLLWGRIVRQRGRNTRCSSGLKGPPPIPGAAGGHGPAGTA